MADKNLNNEIASKLLGVEDKFIEIKSVVKIVNMWVKDKNYELILIINMLNDKMDEVEKIFSTGL